MIRPPPPLPAIKNDSAVATARRIEGVGGHVGGVGDHVGGVGGHVGGVGGHVGGARSPSHPGCYASIYTLKLR